MTKVVSDVPPAWIRKVANRIGARFPMLAGGALNWDEIGDRDYLVGADMLRRAAGRILIDVNGLRQLSEAQSARAGAAKLSLEQIGIHLQDLLQFELEPLVEFVRGSRISKQPEALRGYVDSLLFHAQLQRSEAATRAAAISDALLQYRITSPPDAVGPDAPTARASAATQDADASYRRNLAQDFISARFEVARLQTQQSYYEAIRRGLDGIQPAAGAQSTAAILEQRLKRAFDRTSLALKNARAIYEQISTSQVQPQSLVYSVTADVAQETQSSLSVQRLVLWGLLWMVMAFVLLAIAALAHHYVRGGQSV